VAVQGQVATAKASAEQARRLAEQRQDALEEAAKVQREENSALKRQMDAAKSASDKQVADLARQVPFVGPPFA